MTQFNKTDAVSNTINRIREVKETFSPGIIPHEIGTITSIMAGIAIVSGLPGVGFEEVVYFKGGISGIVFYLEPEQVGVVLLGEYSHLQVGEKVRRSGRVMDVAVGAALLGRVIDPLGDPLDNKDVIYTHERWPIERQAPHIMDRAPVSVPLQTGIKVIDTMIPVGRGQRELIIGDRQTGKTAIAVDTIINQHDTGVICVYCTIGQRASAIAKTLAKLEEYGALEYTVTVVTEGNDPPGMLYIAPYAATSIAEYFMHQGHDVLIVYDDLTKHARAYRELSLLLRRPPGREAFPGDIFYIHSRLLERASRLLPDLGGGSLTALPIVETEAQNIAAYIPTNLISITDGQIYLAPDLFELGVLPAVDVGNSVSRVGGKVQLPAFKAIAGDLKLLYVQFLELELFSRFGARLDQNTKKVLEHGRRIRECLKQPESATLSVIAQIVVLLSLKSGLFDQVPLGKMAAAEQAVLHAAEKLPQQLKEHIVSGEPFTEAEKEALLKVAAEVLGAYGARD